MRAEASDFGEMVEKIKEAFHANDAEAVRRLLELHPEFKARINEPVGPFDSPAIVNACSKEMVDVLLEAGADINAKSKWWAGGFGLLHSAELELARYAIERGAIVDVHAAARLGMFEKLKELVARDSGMVHARGGDGQMPLHFAATIEIAEYLLDHGADIDAKDIDHESTSAQHMVDDRQEVVRYLISRGCRTDILMAAAVGDVELVRQLLDADPEVIRTRVSDAYFPMINHKSGGTIYQWTLGAYMSAHQAARKYGRDDVLNLLFDRSPPRVKLIEACWIEDESAVKTVRAEHPNIANEFTAEDRRQAAYAARNNQTNAVRLLLECGLPVDGRGQHRATPLHWAGFHGNLDMARVILGFNPPLEDAKNDFNGTPLGWAIYGSEHGWYAKTGDYAGTVEALMDAGSRPPDSIGGTAAVQEVLSRKR